MLPQKWTTLFCVTRVASVIDGALSEKPRPIATMWIVTIRTDDLALPGRMARPSVVIGALIGVTTIACFRLGFPDKDRILDRVGDVTRST